MKNFIHILLIALIATSCSTDQQFGLTIPCDSQSDDPYFISLDDALKNAEDEFEIVYGNKTRANHKIISSENFCMKTRVTDESLNGFYIVNYTDGFAILSADTRRPEVYAISDSGNLHLSDTLQNPGLSYYVNNVMTKSNISKPDSTFIPYPPIIIPEKRTKHVYSEPLITGFRAAFHQYPPYNKNCPIMDDGDHAFVGCGPLAIGTVMSFFKWPQYNDGYHYNWIEMNSNPNSAIWPILFAATGKYSKAIYTKDATITNESNYPKAFTSMGYKNAKLAEFSTSTVTSELKNRRPLICAGDNTSKPSGHAWVIDGGYLITVESTQIMDGGSVNLNYFHCLWGNGTTAVGYFLYYNTQKQLGGQQYDENEKISGETYLYGNLKIVYGFEKNQ